MTSETLTFALAAFSAVFVVVDPFAAVPFFLAMTSREPAERLYLVLAGAARVDRVTERPLDTAPPWERCSGCLGPGNAVAPLTGRRGSPKGQRILGHWCGIEVGRSTHR